MRAEIISIGNELLSGHTVNTNAAWIGKKLAETGIDVTWSSVVGDDHELLFETLERAWKRADVTVATGGLGPTHDDITRTVFCDLFKRELVQDRAVLENVTRLFELRGRKISPSNIDQASVPEGTEVLHNSRGTAPGIFLAEGSKSIAMLPGVPSEMKGLMEKEVLPRLERMGTRSVIVYREIRTSGIPESFLNERLKGMDGLENVASLPAITGTLLRVTVRNSQRDAAEARAGEIVDNILERARQWVISLNDEPLEQIVGNMLMDQSLIIATAESCTGGALASRLTDLSGSSSYLHEGCVTYSNKTKIERLGVRPDSLARYGAVSSQVAREMAEGMRIASGADIGLSTTGIAGPTGGTRSKPVGTVCLALAHTSGIVTETHWFGDNTRDDNKHRSVHAALDLLRRWLLEYTGNNG